ncbi:helix-turn-helix domain-containing protein [Kiloniella laminariae]|uniref:Helix-turn-helix domain-containing protein n=1 Tax=Kiloniella laminariae TaxID=454162 RepID=A0ABT4LP02_9PROT|nr:helix-turn-helix domain-containing protein [Kiloniella laminariae]MCZ4281682.1 helix-turn-helix domain-containing protein [Kiloniella laminariae]
MIFDWPANKIRSELMLRGINLSDIDRESGMGPGSASKALKTPWARMQDHIAARLNLAPQAIWPSRYDSRGAPIDNRGRAKSGLARVGS